MKRFIIVGIVVFIVLAYLTTYRVRFTETAVKTTFSKAAAEPDTEPGLKFLVPYVQNVVKYDKRARYLESKPETVQTRDARQIVVTAYLTWKVTDPKLFYQSFIGEGERASNHYRGAERMLSEKLRNAMGAISQFRFDEILATDEQGSRLEECEKKILAQLDGSATGELLTEQFGIQPTSVGVIGMELPEETTSRVFEAMQQNRTRIANDAIAQGTAIAETIRSTATQDARTIIDFAQRRAERIRAQGDIEAQKFQEQLHEQPELAVFIRNMELMKQAFGNNRVTVLIPGGPTGWPGFELFQPGAMDQLKTGKLRPFSGAAAPTRLQGARDPGAPESDDRNLEAVDSGSTRSSKGDNE